MRSRIYICKKKDALSQVLQNLKEMNEILIKNIITEEDLPLNSQDDTPNKRKHQHDDNEDDVPDTKRLKVQKKKGPPKADWHHRNRVGKKANIYRKQYKVFVPLNGQSQSRNKNKVKTPAWGGTAIVNEKTVNLTNTCPIDNWLVYVSTSKNIYNVILNSKKINLLTCNTMS